MRIAGVDAGHRTYPSAFAAWPLTAIFCDLRRIDPAKVAGDTGSASARAGSLANGRTTRPDLTLRVVRAHWVDVEIYNLHAALWLSMAGANQPGSIPELGVADLG